MDTSSTLLARVRAGNQAAWERFVALYTPLLYFWVRRSGCSTQEADDLVQEVFATLVQKLPEFAYDRERRFRAWLKTVALNKWRQVRRKRVVGVTGAEVPEPEIPDPAEGFWEQEYREHLVHRALLLMKNDFEETSWKACWQVVVEGKPAPQVAAELGLTPGAVHAAKFRILSRLREELTGLVD